MWGSEWAWGYDKPPPLSGWTAAALALGDFGPLHRVRMSDKTYCRIPARTALHRLAAARPAQADHPIPSAPRWRE
ncbi:MAG: hypothetical protein OSB39_12320 [Opitutales bacterium]|nr:hypothetical protein [Opitutales bacterium]MDE0817991.1 hypothetical protein [Pirellulaceae bacterium]